MSLLRVSFVRAPCLSEPDNLQSCLLLSLIVQDFFIQTMDIEEGDSGKFGFDPLDCTKVIDDPHCC